jgi:predicted nucleotidyltransferase
MAVRHAPVINTSPVNDRALAAAVAALASCDGVQTAYLLGSAASGRLRSDSDVDVAILPSRRSGLSVQDRLFLTAALARVFGRTVDLGVLSTANVVYAKEAVATGRVLFERDHYATARFAMLALSMYASLQEARREVLKAYAA